MEKKVLIIGASGDIGLAAAKQLAGEGYQLLLHYNRNRGMLDQFKDHMEQDNILGLIQANLAEDDGIKQLLSELVYPIDAIVFAGGSALFGLFQETPEKAMDDMLRLYVKAPWMITKHLLPAMIQKNAGKIILITSIWGHVGASNEVVYSAVKGAQNSFVKALAKEVAPCGVSVNAVSPGFIDTGMNSHLQDVEKEAIIADIPMNRAGTVEEVAHIVSFLLNKNTSYIQGEVIGITGGWQ
jgi:3-oxoacyl-[acyl-carrier protein] reductase